MVRVDAHALELVLEAVLADFERLELVLVHVGPPEELRVEHVREVLAAGHLRAKASQSVDGGREAGEGGVTAGEEPQRK